VKIHARITQREAVRNFFLWNPNQDHRLHEIRDAVVVMIDRLCSETSVSARIREVRDGGLNIKCNQRNGAYWYRYNEPVENQWDLF
jgi:hypothetical protein